ncbi:MAG: SPOR domain-containing protein [Sulfuricella denitrificans]|nr:SPOR domain-containing protein [Sulfuricella denitrificans]
MMAFMRWIFALLVISNVAFFAVMQLPQHNPDSDSMANHTPYRAEQIHLLPEADLTQAQQSEQPAPPPRICLEWGIFSKTELAHVQDMLKTLQLGEDAITLSNAPEKTSKYWVYIPPLKSKTESQKKQEELKGLGIEDSLIMQDNNKWRYAISLGVFSTQAAADKYLSQIRAKNVKSAHSGPRILDDGHTVITIKASGRNLETDLIKMKLDFPGTELKAVSCS